MTSVKKLIERITAKGALTIIGETLKYTGESLTDAERQAVTANKSLIIDELTRREKQAIIAEIERCYRFLAEVDKTVDLAMWSAEPVGVVDVLNERPASKLKDYLAMYKRRCNEYRAGGQRDDQI